MSVQSIFNPADHEFLSALGVSAEDKPPRPVVAMDMYLAAIRSAERALAETHRVRAVRKRWRQRYKRLRRELEAWRVAVMLLGVAVVILLAGRFS